ncbi:MAG: hypothetical protein JKY65_25510 [Planctomycetes bacterium]|nr:hypothetical protein [Planctomycetota bacterium]
MSHTRLALGSALLMGLLVGAGCNSGSRSTKAATVAPTTSATTTPTTSTTTAPTTTTVTTTTVAWDTPYTATPAIQNDSLIALHLLAPDQILAGSPLGQIQLIDLAAGTVVSEGSYGSVSAFAAVGGNVFIGTGQPFFMQGGQGEVFVRDAQGNYTVSLDHPLTAITVAALGNDVYAFASNYTGNGDAATVSQLTANAVAWSQDVATLPSCQINKAVAWRNEIWAAGSDNLLSGGLRLFRGTGANFTEVTGLPSARTPNSANELQLVTDIQVINGELYISTVVTDPTVGNVITGAIYRSFDGSAWTTVATTPNDSPMAIAQHQGTLFVGLISGAVQSVDSTGTLVADTGVPTSTGAMSMIEVDADTLVVGVRGTAGAELIRRVTTVATTTVATATPTTTGTTTGTTTAPAMPAITYTADVKPILVARCTSCHSGTSLPAAVAGYPLTITNDTADYAETVNRTNPQTPDASLLLTKATGNAHGGGAVLTVGSAEHTTLIQWIQGGSVR